MKIEQLIFMAFLMVIVCYIGGLIWYIKDRANNAKRLQIAKEKNWVVPTQIINRKNVISAKKADFTKDKTRSMVETVYEYEINGKKRQIKITAHPTQEKLDEIYYDLENDYKVLNLRKKNVEKVILLLPIIVFVGIILIGKFIFGV